jgi:hypothetical protein
VYSDSSLNNAVSRYGARIRAVLQKKSGFPRKQIQAYVNYAQGDETFGDLYGYEPWRQRKLKALKKQYDPSGDFSWYQPIPL